MSDPSDVPRPGARLPAPGPAEADLEVRLAGLPGSGHADVLAAEHERLHQLLATIDQL